MDQSDIELLTAILAKQGYDVSKRNTEETDEEKEKITQKKEYDDLKKKRDDIKKEYDAFMDENKRKLWCFLPNGTKIKYEGNKVHTTENVKMIGTLQYKDEIEFKIEYNGKLYSPSGFASEGYGQQRNGWEHCKVETKNGEWVSIDDIHKHV